MDRVDAHHLHGVDLLADGAGPQVGTDGGGAGAGDDEDGDQPVDPGTVIPAPTIDTGENPLPANRLPQPPAPASDPLSPPGRGTATCNGQQPNPCTLHPDGVL